MKGQKEDNSGQNLVSSQKCLHYVAKAENKTSFDGVKGWDILSGELEWTQVVENLEDWAKKCGQQSHGRFLRGSAQYALSVSEDWLNVEEQESDWRVRK